jgi:glutamate dehydrogenase (NADP+)
MSSVVSAFMEKVKAKNPGEKEFHQAVEEVVTSLMPFIEKNPRYQKAKILERMVEPERVIMFRWPGLMTKERCRSIADSVSR